MRSKMTIMQKNTLFVADDPMGAAIYDYHKNGKADKLRVFSSCMEEDEIPVSELFRTFSKMPNLEQIALKMARGNILDVGGGSGCHSLALKEMGKETLAIDISPLAVASYLLVKLLLEVGEKHRLLQIYLNFFCKKKTSPFLKMPF